MSAFLIRRLLRFVVVCIGVSLVTFAILHASGDPVALIMPEAPEADRAKLREALGLSDPLPTQFVRFVANAARGDFGQSFFHRAPAFGLVVERMPTTLALTCLAVVLALAVALPVGIYSAVRRNTLRDHAATVGRLSRSIDARVLDRHHAHAALRGAVAAFARLGLGDVVVRWCCPSITLGAFTTPLFMRIIRSSMLEVINLDYVRTARAKGLSEWLVICRHALRNAALPIVTVIGLQFGLLLGGAVLTETVFAVPGVGRLIVGAIRQLDFPIVQAGVFLLAIIIVSVNFLVDVLYVYLNPTIRLR